jgi:uncharacterized SAM-binding protein YcdF (DUF218 family)
MRIDGFWTIPDNPPTRPDCFIIPSYALRDRSLPTLPTRAQIELACQWWSRFPQAKLIMSTGDNQGLGITNARVMAQYARSLGVPAAKIIEEGRSLNTDQNLRFSLDIVRAEHCAQPTLVTLDLHTRRAVATARRQGWPPFYWLSVFSRGQSAYGLKAVQTHSRLTILLYEMAASVYSKAAGWS